MDNLSAKDIITKQKVEFAIKHHKMLSFDYVNQDFDISKGRLAEPYEILWIKNTPRVKAHDILKNEIRMFHMEGIQNLELKEYTSYGV